MTTDYIFYIIYAAITNFDVITIEDLVTFVTFTKFLSNKCKNIHNITFNIFTNIGPDDISILLIFQFLLIF